jgi:predicted outer membrane repeat protein
MLLIFVSVFFLMVPTCRATVIHVPADCPTIQDGINAAAPGDTVLVASGTYSPSANGESFPIVMVSSVALLSESGPDVTVVDAEGTNTVVRCHGVNSAAAIEGFTITGGAAGTGISFGGGMYCFQSSPQIESCVFRENWASDKGGGMYCSNLSMPMLWNVLFVDNSCGMEGGGMAVEVDSSPYLSDCDFIGNEAAYGAGICFWNNFSGDPFLSEVRFLGNTASAHGGACYCRSTGPWITDCLFSSNSAHSGGAFYCSQSSPSIHRTTFFANAGVNGGIMHCSSPESMPGFEYSILAFSTQGVAVNCVEECSPVLTCCDVYGNEGGDWVGCIAGQLAVNGNFSEDPLFCTGCYSLQECSPCVQGYGCGQIGAYGAACPCGGGPSAVEETSWSKVKAQYR